MKSYLLSTLTFSLLASLAQAAAPFGSGVQAQAIDTTVRAQDNFFRYSQGSWLKSTEIPADKSDWGSFMKAREDVQQQLRGIVEGIAASTENTPGSDRQKIADLYASFLDEAKLEQLGLQPLKAEMTRIAALNDKGQIPALIAHYNQIGVGAPYTLNVHQDNKEATRYVADINQSGLGLPNRDYYLKLDDPKTSEVRAKYQLHVEKMLSLAGNKEAAANAGLILALETAMATAQWSAVENRDPVKGYNLTTIATLQGNSSAYDWQAYFEQIGIQDQTTKVNISQPSYLQGFSEIMKNTPLTVWQSYFEWQLINSYSPYLSSALVAENFAFKGAVLSGAKENRTRQKRAISLVDQTLGESIGRSYVEKYFPAERKEQTAAMVGHFLTAFKESIEHLDWMSSETKKEAQIKLAKIKVKVGYPNTWRDYSALTIARDDLLGNVMRAHQWEAQRELNKLGKAIDHEEWSMTPQTVNAYYSPEMNEIVFPAARMQAPLVDVNAEDAFNYGALGISIGHEISHAFDDSGSQYDGDGNLRDWWTKEDRVRFAAKTKVLVDQYNGYSPVQGHFLNGELTLGENIADNAGIVMALKAYKISLAGKPAPVIDGWTAEQRLFMGLAQARRNKAREQRALALIKTDPHSPAEFRVNGSLKNLADFYQAFEVKDGDKMYLSPEQRVTIW
ncbi:M13 family metallopeptidase [Undibacterium sp. Ren11W]|uniref:M13 family metallopeptidase n=1 Tax=Undibacterium sp. Ren11W TaxID=3413045 RepID=UPI003BEF5943